MAFFGTCRRPRWQTITSIVGCHFSTTVNMPIPPPLSTKPTSDPKKLEGTKPKMQPKAPTLESQLDEIQAKMDKLKEMSPEEFDARYKEFKEVEAKV